MIHEKKDSAKNEIRSETTGKPKAANMVPAEKERMLILLNQKAKSPGETEEDKTSDSIQDNWSTGWRAYKDSSKYEYDVIDLDKNYNPIAGHKY